MTKELVTLKTGNTSWWKNKKYRWEAAFSIREFRKSGFKVKFIHNYYYLNLQLSKSASLWMQKY